MGIRQKKLTDLVGMAYSMSEALQGHKVKCLNNGVADQFALELTAAKGELESAMHNSASLTTKLRASNTTKNERKLSVVKLLSQVQATIDASNGSDEDYKICGLDPRKRWSVVKAKTPTMLVAIALNGRNKIKFRGNNRLRSVVYTIFRRDSRSGPWEYIGTTLSQSFTDEPVRTGQFFQYKAQAVSSKNKSGMSNIGTVNSN